MKKLLALLVGLPLIANTAFAAEVSRPYYVGMSLGYVLPEDLGVTDTAEPTVALADLDMDDAWCLGLKGGWLPPMLNGVLAVELEYKHAAGIDIDEQYFATVAGIDVNAMGEMSADSLYLNLILRHPEGRFHPYAGVGLGWSWLDLEDVRLSASVAGIKLITEASDDGGDDIAYQLLAGCGIELRSDITLDLGYRYTYTEPELDRFAFELEYSAHEFLAGLTLHF